MRRDYDVTVRISVEAKTAEACDEVARDVGERLSYRCRGVGMLGGVVSTCAVDTLDEPRRVRPVRKAVRR